MKLSLVRFGSPLGRVLRGTLLVALLGATSAAAATGDDRKVERYDVKKAGSSAGAARAVVFASNQVVRSVVTDFGQYEKFISRFKSAKIVGRSGNKTDVYLQVPILKGAVKIWAVVRFEPPKASGEDQVIVGRMIKGNVKRLDAVWRIRQIDDKKTDLRLELTIVPDLPVPESLVMGEVRYAAAKAVSGTRDEAERRAGGS